MSSTNRGFLGIVAAVLVTVCLPAVDVYGAERMRMSPGDTSRTLDASAMNKVVKMQKKDFKQLQSLPDDAVVEINGKQATKKQIMANIEDGQRRYKAEMAARAEKAKAASNAKLASLRREQKDRLAARNAKVQAEFAVMKPKAEQYAKIRAEALQMNAKYASASPEEKQKMDQRAGELMAQLKNLGY